MEQDDDHQIKQSNKLSLKLNVVTEYTGYS